MQIVGEKEEVWLHIAGQRMLRLAGIRVISDRLSEWYRRDWKTKWLVLRFVGYFYKSNQEFRELLDDWISGSGHEAVEIVAEMVTSYDDSRR